MNDTNSQITASKMQKESDHFYWFLNDLGKDIFMETFHNVMDKARDLFRNDFELFKIFWNYEEKNTLEYSFNNAVSWLKQNFTPGKNYKGGIYRFPKNSKDVIELHVFFIENGKPLMNGSAPHLVVNTSAITDDLKKMFDNKNLIIIQ